MTHKALVSFLLNGKHIEAGTVLTLKQEEANFLKRLGRVSVFTQPEKGEIETAAIDQKKTSHKQTAALR